MAVEVVEDGGVPGRRVLRPLVTEAVSARPGPELVTALLALGQRELSAREWVEVAVAWKKVVSFATAGMYAAVGHLDQQLAGDPTALPPPAAAPRAPTGGRGRRARR